MFVAGNIGGVKDDAPAPLGGSKMIDDGWKELNG